MHVLPYVLPSLIATALMTVVGYVVCRCVGEYVEFVEKRRLQERILELRNERHNLLLELRAERTAARAIRKKEDVLCAPSVSS